jgi:histidine triad (HIT) family protein
MDDCRFCAIASGGDHAVVVHEDVQTMAFLDHRPLFHGHTLWSPSYTSGCCSSFRASR